MDGYFDEPQWLMPSEEMEIRNFGFTSVFVNQLGLADPTVREGKQFLLFWGFTRYLDTMTEDIHETRFCYRVIFHDAGNQLVMFRLRDLIL